MANEKKLPYVRFIRQVSSSSKSIVGWKTTMAETFEALKVADWVQATSRAEDVMMPVNAPLTFTVDDKYDCFKMTSTVEGSGRQTCHMGMVAYRFKIPDDAITNSIYPTAISLSLGADKFNTSGLRVAAYVSDTATPPTDWTTCREGTEYIPDETIDSVTLGILASRVALVSNATNSSGDYTITFDPALSANNAYLYIIVSLYDYESYRTSREYYIEGAGVLDGANVQVSFADAVTADAPASPLVGLPVIYSAGGGRYGFSVAGVSNFYYNLALFPGNSANVFSAYTALIKPAASVTWDGTNSAVSGSLIVGYIPKKEKDVTAIYFKDLDVDLSSATMDVYVNVWTSPPMIDPATRNYIKTGYPDKTEVLASALQTMFFNESSITLPMLDSSGGNKQDITLTHVGSTILRKGTAYDENTKFEVNIPNTNQTPLTLYVTIAPYNVTKLETTTALFPDDDTGEIYLV